MVQNKFDAWQKYAKKYLSTEIELETLQSDLNWVLPDVVKAMTKNSGLPEDRRDGWM